MSVRALFLASALAGLAPLAAANGEGVREVLVVERGGAHIWIALDAMPTGLQAQSAPGRLVLDLPGLRLAEARRIVPVGGGPLAGVSAAPVPQGARLVVEGDFDTAEASLRQGGIWIALDGRLDEAAAMAAARPQHSAATPPDTRPQEPVSRIAPTELDHAGASPNTDAALERSGLAPQAASSEGAPADSGPYDGAGRDEPPLPPGAASPVAPARDADETAPDAAAPETQVQAAPDSPGPCDATAAAVQQSPWDLDALTRHADCLAGLGPAARDNAAGLYERVLAFEPTHFQAAIGLARIREAQGRGEEAAALFERAANAALTDGEALAARAAAERSRQD